MNNPNIKLIIDGKRLDGRELDESRPFKIEAGVLNRAQGSALVEWGGNKIIAAVYGPHECIPRHDCNPYKARLSVRYIMSPFASKDEHGRMGPNRRSVELSMVLREALESTVLLEKYPKAQIDVYIEVLQAAGGTRCASLVAAAVALANAGIPMRDLPVAVAAGKIEDKVCLDCSKEEDNFGQADVPVGLLPKTNEIILLQMDGLMTKEELFQAIEYVKKEADKIRKAEVEALQKAYKVIENERN